MQGEFSRIRPRSRNFRATGKKIVAESSDHDESVRSHPSRTASSSMLSFDVEEEVAFSLKKNIEPNKNTRSDFVSVQFNKNIVSTPENTIIDKTDPSFSVKINPINSITTFNSRPKIVKPPPDSAWDDLEDTFEQYQETVTKIADPATIHAAKKKRESYRRGREIIPLESSTRSDLEKHTDSRLVREDEGFSTSDEEFADSAKDQIPLDHNFNESSNDEKYSIGEEDDEASLWETQQMQKGAGAKTTHTTSTFGPSIPYFLQNKNTDPKTQINYNCSVPCTDPRKICAKIEAKSAELQNNIINHRQSLKDVEEKIKVTEEDIQQAESSYLSMKSGFEFYQYIFGYISDFISCYNEKFLDIIRLETDYLESLKKDWESRENRIKDIVVLIDNKINSFIEDSRNDDSSFTDLIADLEHSRSSFSFDASPENYFKIEASRLFEDVSPEFVEIQIILKLFNRWKMDFQTTYLQAYIHSCLYKLLAPLIRSLLIDWCPLTDRNGLPSHDWFRAILDYCCKDKDLIDYLLLPKLYDHVICQKIIPFISIWNCCSYDQTLNLRNTIKLIFQDNPEVTEKSKNFTDLFLQLFMRLRSYSESIFIPIYPVRLLEIEDSAAVAFLVSQIMYIITFLTNLVLWRGLIDPDKLNSLALHVINNSLVVCLTQIPDIFLSLNLCSQLVDIVPCSWLHSALSSKNKTLIEYVRAAHTMLLKMKEHPLDSQSDIDKINDGIHLAQTLLTKISQQKQIL